MAMEHRQLMNVPAYGHIYAYGHGKAVSLLVKALQFVHVSPLC